MNQGNFLDAIVGWIKTEPLISTAAGFTSLVGMVLAILPNVGIHLSSQGVATVTSIAGIIALFIGRSFVTSNTSAVNKVQTALMQPTPTSPNAALALAKTIVNG